MVFWLCGRSWSARPGRMSLDSRSSSGSLSSCTMVSSRSWAAVVGFVAFPILLLAGLLTSLLPGAWLLDGLELRLVNPARGEVVRPAEWFERTLGPVGAVAILAGFVTLLHTSGFSYELALYDLG